MELLSYAVARIFALAMGLLPFRWASALGAVLGRLAFALDRRHRLRALEAIAGHLPERSPEERLRLARASFSHLGRCLAEFPHLARLGPENVGEFIEMKGLDRIREALGRGRGAMLITGHIGLWELTGSALAASGVTLLSIARPVDNPRVNAWVDSVRTRSGQRIVQKEGAMRASLRHLREGGAVGILMDQDAGSGGLFAEFLGEPASTIDAPARLAMRADCPVLPVTSFRDSSGGRHVLRVGPEVEMVRTGDEESNAVENTRRMNAALSDAIREHPEQWLWVHRRWKTQARRKAAEGPGVEGEPDGG